MTQETIHPFEGLDMILGLGCLVGVPSCMLYGGSLFKEGNLALAVCVSLVSGMLAQLLLKLVNADALPGERAWKKLWNEACLRKSELADGLQAEPLPVRCFLGLLIGSMEMIILPCWSLMTSAVFIAILLSIIL